ncbi:hypothetical protein [Cohaesibacter gelatinilyticus]|uniref:Uncharacterized protein n=1 Tax=Cohaesibacter gelatinilyticus TaxID=372072 RepID=A0A285PHI1_9HYPH|nr:hypothetical protein [Cohaesibacter gelatinilyticus]SNZ21190.1 hypothetical protein SAMN06265368_4307 [Cohaesibacter gelatinilyticus]
MFISASIALFLVFIANVLAGAFGNAQFLSETGEMLVLVGASLAFVVVMLKQEAHSKNRND